MPHTIAINLSPNSTPKDCFIALKQLILPWRWLRWRRGRVAKELEQKFTGYFAVKQAISFASGRESLYAILKALGIKEGDEVILQAYTCLVVPNSIIWTGAQPVYCDIDETFNIDPEDIRKKITPRTKVIIVQHTFGHAADLEAIGEICGKHNITLIEDCAHSLGAGYNKKATPRLGSGQKSNEEIKIGTFGKAAFFSFGRDKVISSVHGGMIITNDDELSDKLRELRDNSKPVKRWEVMQNLFHPLAFAFIVPTYFFFSLGKVKLWLLQELRLLSRIMTKKEKQGIKPLDFTRPLPNALALLALNQFEHLEEWNAHRKKLAKFYTESLKGLPIKLPAAKPEADHIFMRYTILADKPHELRAFAQKHKIILGDWYDKVLAPWYADLDKLQYQTGSCPKAEEACKKTVNLPTHWKVGEQEGVKVAEVIKKFYRK